MSEAGRDALYETVTALAERALGAEQVDAAEAMSALIMAMAALVAAQPDPRVRRALTATVVDEFEDDVARMRAILDGGARMTVGHC